MKQMIQRLHFTNTRPMWAKANISKSNKEIAAEIVLAKVLRSWILKIET